MKKNPRLVSFLALCLSGFIFLMASEDKETVAHSLAQQAEPQISRPEGWTEETHGDTADPDYDVVFAQNVVKRIDLTIEPADWQAMLDDMTENYGEYGQWSCGKLIPRGACWACRRRQDGDPCAFRVFFGLIRIEGTCIAIPGGQLVCEPHTLPPGAPSPPVPPGGIPPDDFFGRSPDPIYRPCTLKFDGKTWWHVGVRFKGQSTLMYPWQLGIMKLPFRFDMDEFEDEYPAISDQRFFGFKELSMVSNFNDNSLLREKVVGDIFREAGVPAAQNAFYRLFVDYGEGPIYFGLYTMVEVPRKPMLESQFDDPDGNLYKPEGSGARWVTFDQESFTKKTNESENDWSDIEAAFAALHAPRDDSASWRAGLEAVFDVDGFLRWLAVNTVIQNWDTYGIMPQNYYVYTDPSDGQIHWIPWDNNEALKSTGKIADPLPLVLDSTAVDESWPLIRHLMDDPVYRATYLSFVYDTIEGAFSVNPFQTRLLNAHYLIAPYVIGPYGEQAGYTWLTAPEAFETELDNLLTHVEQRRQEALQFLDDESFEPADIIINEIHYNPSRSQGDDQDYEFIELYNRGEVSIDLSGYSLTRAIEFTFPQDSSIAPGEYIVIANTADTYGDQGYQVFEWESGNLSNDGETIILKDANGVVIDFVNYDDLLPWPLEPDGDEPSLALVDPSLPNSLPGNWKASDGVGGTPGSINVTVIDPDRPEGWTEVTHGDNASPNYDVVYAQDVVKRIDLIFDPADWQAMLDNMTAIHGPFNAGMPNPGAILDLPDPMYRPCTFMFEGRTWWHVGVRFKGQSTLAFAWGMGIMKLPFRFDMDEFEDDYPEVQNQRFYGFKELSLANNFSDNSLLREKVGADVFRDAGVPAPQTAFYRLFVDYGEGPIYFGLYTMVEVPRQPLLETQFGDSSGNLYKAVLGDGATWSVYDQSSFEKKTNRGENDWSDMEALFTALHASRTDPAAWRAGLEAEFDADGFLRWLAVNTLIQNWDTYGNMPQNYFLYSDPSDGLLHWIPWDNNMAFLSSGGPGLALPLSLCLEATAVGDDWPLIRYLIDDPVYQPIYVSYVNDTIEGAFSVTRQQQRLQDAHALIAPYVVGPEGEQEGYTVTSPTAFEDALEALLNHVETRREKALQFLADGTCTEPSADDKVVATVTVPFNFTCTPELISAVFFTTFPPQPGTMPAGIGDSYSAPQIGPGTPYELTTTQTGLEGEYYLAVTLYCEGGGGGLVPVSGVDWVGGTMFSPLTLGPGTGTVDAGRIRLMLTP